MAAGLEVAAVMHAGQWIGQAGQLQAFVIERIFQTDGKDGRQPLEEVGAAVGRKAFSPAAAQIQAADQLVLPHQWQQGHRLASIRPRVEYGPQQFGIESSQVRARVTGMESFQQDQSRRFRIATRFGLEETCDLVFRIGQHQGNRVGVARRLVVLQHHVNELGQRARGDQLLFQLFEAAQLLLVQARLVQQALKLPAQKIVFGLQIVRHGPAFAAISAEC